MTIGSLGGSVAIVTGAAGALGRASVLGMLGHGAQVVASDRDSNGLERLAAEVDDVAQFRVKPCDVTEEDDVADLVRFATREFGGLDVMFNNAGVVGLEHGMNLLELSTDIWEATLAVNLRGVMLGCKYAVPAMIDRGGGSIINTSSCSAFVGDFVNTAYSSSKAAVNALTRNVAAAFGQYNIRCNAIAPGIHIADDVIDHLPETVGEFTQESVARLKDHCMLPRLGRPEDIADAAVFLASAASSYITAQTISVSGGLTDHTPHYADVKRHGSVYLADKD